MLSLRRVVAFLFRVSRNVPRVRLGFAAIVVLGVIAGLGNTLLLALINDQLHAGGRTTATLWAFAGLCLLVPVGRFGSTLLLQMLTERATFELRMRLCRKILRTPLAQLEEIKPHRLLASVTDDVAAITGALISIPRLTMYLAIVVGCLVYLGWLSLPGLGLVLVFVAVGGASYRWPMARAGVYFDRARRLWDDWFKGLKALTEGTKELKVHRERRQDFEDRGLARPLRELLASSVRASAYTTAAASWGQVLAFVLIGVVIFALPRFGALDDRVLTGYALTILYMVGPLESLLNLLPGYRRAQTAVRKVEELGLSLADEAGGEPDDAAPPAAGWRTLELAGVTHSYRRDGDADSFTLGPIDLAIRRGELVFLVGGNGSGKTTLAKILVGLYVPEAGEVRLDGRPVTEQDRDGYRQLFSVVFSDFFLFETLLGLGAPELDERARRHLARLQLQHKVDVEQGTLTTLDLSQGQRKRLALLTAYLEDRPIYLFDEWAADQDPYFKEVFYRELLPELKARGKTIVVISHDDRYYDVGDRLVKLDSGQLVEDETLAADDGRVVVAGPGGVSG